jgi:glycine/D-amino acid oxidase-like deaminating enzyme
MPGNDYIDSYYAATLPARAPRPSLQEGLEAEVCVIGGGLAGLTAARELAQRGRDVVLLEARRVGWGASGRNGGSVSPGFAQGQTALEQRLGMDHARKLHDLSAAGAAYIEAAVAETGAGEVIEGRGSLRLIRHGDVAGLRALGDRLGADYGEEVEFWDGERVRACLRTSLYRAGLHYPKGFQIHPLHYALVFAELAEREGLRLFEASPALSLRRQGAGWRTDSANGSVTSQHWSARFCRSPPISSPASRSGPGSMRSSGIPAPSAIAAAPPTTIARSPATGSYGAGASPRDAPNRPGWGNC